jgi:hypothetical protein
MLKICRDKFFARDTRETKQRSHEFNEDVVSKIGKAFEIVSEIQILKPEAEDDGDYGEDNDIWLDWKGNLQNYCDGSGGNEAVEEYTSQSMTERRKIAYTEDKDTTDASSQPAAGNLEDDASKDSRSDNANSDNLVDVNQKIAEYAPTDRTLTEQSNSQNGNNTISVIPSLNDSKNQLEEYNNYLCYYCDYKTNNKYYYERHVVLRHDHSPAYPNKAEIEKRGLKPKGKEWEI